MSVEGGRPVPLEGGKPVPVEGGRPVPKMEYAGILTHE